MNTLHIVNQKFDLDVIDETLKQCLPGKYHIVIHTKQAVWECDVKWNGMEWYDLNNKLDK